MSSAPGPQTTFLGPVTRNGQVPAQLPAPPTSAEREFFIDNLSVRIHFIIVMIRWDSLAPRKFEFPFPGKLTSTFLLLFMLLLSTAPQRRPMPPFPSPRPHGRPPALRERPGLLRCTT